MKRFSLCLAALLLSASAWAGPPRQPNEKGSLRTPSVASATLFPPINLIENADFETGDLSPWFKWPAGAAGLADIESCCGNQTPDGFWDGYIQPKGEYVELTQNVPVIAGKRYRLEATVSTRGMVGSLYWYTNVSGDRLCASTSVAWPAVARIGCIFTIPFGTTIANVHLAGTGPVAHAWAISDDWSLIDINDIP